MKSLWAPWRMEFILQEKEQGCIFCNRVQSSNDQQNLILARGDKSFVVLNKYPYSVGHLMIVPYVHSDTLKALDAQTSAEMMSFLSDWTELMQNAVNAEGFNIGLNLGRAAGAGITDHVHFHLVPRWVGDTNFMPVFTETKVLPEALQETYKKLKDAWEAR